MLGIRCQMSGKKVRGPESDVRRGSSAVDILSSVSCLLSSLSTLCSSGGKIEVSESRQSDLAVGK